MRQAVQWSLAVSCMLISTTPAAAELEIFHRWVRWMGVSWRYSISSQ
jgi:hypothetical protein